MTDSRADDRLRLEIAVGGGATGVGKVATSVRDECVDVGDGLLWLLDAARSGSELLAAAVGFCRVVGLVDGDAAATGFTGEVAFGDVWTGAGFRIA